MSATHKDLRSLVCAASLAFLAGCANLAEIQEFGKLSADSAGYTRLTDEYLTAPERQKKYTLASETDARATLDRLGKERLKQAEQLKLYHRAIEGYMTALADLAGDQVTAYDKELGGLVDSAAKGSLIAKDETASLKAISGLLADAATDYYRQRKLHEVIERANAPLQDVLRDLTAIMEGYGAAIEDERAAFTAYYQLLIATARENGQQPPGTMKEPAAAQLISDTFDAQAPSFETRKKAVDAYLKTLKTIAEAHQNLYDNRDRLSSDNLLAATKNYSKKIRDAYKAFHQLAGNN
jgi:hypothetical protein